jgi:hypothetical protein
VVRSCRIGRYRLKFSRLAHTRTAVVVDDPTFVKPPLYSQDRGIAKVPLELDSAGCPSELASPHPTSLIVELPTERSERLLSKSVRACYQSSPCVHELPGSAPMTSLNLHNVGIFELDSQIPTNPGRQDYSAQLTPVYNSAEIPESFDKWYQLSPAEASNAELVPIASPANHLRLLISNQAGSTPGTISSYPSSTPSPVSPMTPNLEAVQYSPTQRQPDVSPVNFGSPDQLFSTPLEHFSNADDQDQVLAAKNSEADIMTLDSSLRNEPSGWQQHTHGVSSLLLLEHGASSGPQGCHESFESEPSDEFSGRVWGDFGGFVTNNDSLGVGPWYHTTRNEQEALTSGQFACPPVPALAYPRSVNCAVRNFQHGQEQQLPHRVPPTPLGLGTTGHNADYPIEVCAICEAQFTGKYVWYPASNFGRWSRTDALF